MRFSFLFLLALTACAASSKPSYPYRVLQVKLHDPKDASNSKTLEFCTEAGKCIVLEATIFERLRSDEISCRNRLEELEKKLND